jgi:hypothetical protein
MLSRMRIRLVVVAMLFATCFVGRAGAAPDAIRLSDGSSVATWQGSTFENAATPGPEACAVDGMCDVVDLIVDVPAAFWSSHPAAVPQVGIQWKDFSAAESEAEYDDFDLYVYDEHDVLVASSVGGRSSMGIASTAQVVDLPHGSGAYRVVVVPANVESRSYRGVAMVQLYEPAHAGALLPELRALQPTNFKTSIGTYSLSRVRTDVRSCYAEETVEDVGNPTRCLRFDAGHSNTGDGALLFDVDLSTLQPVTDDQGRPALGGTVYQVIEGAAGRREVGSFVVHPNHAHIHFKAFARYALYAVRADGTRGAEVVPSKKSDFCMIDVDDLWFGVQGNQPRTHHFPQCNTFDSESLGAGGGFVQHQGINRGWADIYTWDLPGQYIDISSVGDGVYDVVNEVNPLGVISEMDSTNNVAVTRIRLETSAEATTVVCIPEPYGCPAGT